MRLARCISCAQFILDCIFHVPGLFKMVYFMLSRCTHIGVFRVLSVYGIVYFMCSVYIGWCVGSEVSDKREMSWLDGPAPRMDFRLVGCSARNPLRSLSYISFSYTTHIF